MCIALILSEKTQNNTRFFLTKVFLFINDYNPKEYESLTLLLNSDEEYMGKSKKSKKNAHKNQHNKLNEKSNTRFDDSKKSILKEIIFGGGIVAVFLTIAWDQYKKWESDWDLIDSEVQTLIYLIMDTDIRSNSIPPPYTSTRELKIKFVRESQISIHTGSWKYLGSQIPEISEDSDRRKWRDAIAGHNRIEKSEHPNEYTNLMLKAKWKTIAASATNQTATFNGELLKLITVPIVACKNCLSMKSTKMNTPNGISSAEQVTGLVVDKLPNNEFSKYYPVFELDHTANKTNSSWVRKPKFLIPSFESIKKMESNGTLVLRTDNKE